MFIGLIIVLSLMVIGSLVYLFWDNIKHFKEKRFFSKDVASKVYQLAVENDYYLINEVALAIDTKVIHFDHILFTNKYIYCIGVKYFPGPISGKYDDSQWFLYNGKNKVLHIRNPMQLSKVRLDYLKIALKDNQNLFVSVILVNDSCIIDEKIEFAKNNKIMKLKEFKNHVRKQEKSDIPSINPIQLDTLVQNIYKRKVQTINNLTNKNEIT
jgi:hypothetical protein